MSALGFRVDVDTTGGEHPTLLIDGAEVPIAEFGYHQGPRFATWTFVVPVTPSEDDGALADLLASVDPAELEAEAMGRVDAYEGQAAPITLAVLAVLRDAFHARP